jgi:hypothetical protein
MIHKAPHKENFTIVSNNYLHSPDLSFAAKGLLTYLLSLPPDWKVKQAALTNVSTDGRDKVRSLLRELEKHGYVKRIYRDANGIPEHDYAVYEAPEMNESGKIRKSENPKVGKSESGKTRKWENPTLLNTIEQQSTKLESTKDETEALIILSNLGIEVSPSYLTLDSIEAIIDGRFDADSIKKAVARINSGQVHYPQRYLTTVILNSESKKPCTDSFDNMLQGFVDVVE